jgi:hypothetical protein
MCNSLEAFPAKNLSFLNNHYPAFVAIGQSADDEETELNSQRLKELVDQLCCVIESSDDLSNNAVYHIVSTDHFADVDSYETLAALLG